jgi:carotenoid cleavage dioxygenase
MTLRFTRRDALRMAGLGAFSFVHPPFLTGCSSDKSAAAAGGADAGPLPPLVYDPGKSWWMQHNYGPVASERSELKLEVEGAIPTELDGLYVRSGSNPKHADPGHWFLGNGMLHGVRLQGGKALWYKNRYVQTPLLDRVPPDGGSVGPPALLDTASNVSLVGHAGRLLSLGEVGYPYEINPADLSTVGAYTFADKLHTSMTAHPKLDPVTGEMLMFAYGFSASDFLTYHHVDAGGALTRSEPITLPAGVMMHDFQATATKIVFMDLPIVFDFAMAIAGSAFPFKWDAKNGARLGIMPRDGGNADVTWIDIDPCFIFHTMNAYDDANGNVILEACRYPELWVDGPDGFDAFPKLHRYTIDPKAKTAKLEPLDDRLLEFPQLDRRKMGRENRYGYALWLSDPKGQNHPNGVGGVVKFDRKSSTSTVHPFDAALQPDEAFFVPAAKDAAEDDGWLLSYVYDRRTDRTSLHIIDASRMDAPPVAKVKLPFRVPFGFHGLWVPA